MDLSSLLSPVLWGVRHRSQAIRALGYVCFFLFMLLPVATVVLESLMVRLAGLAPAVLTIELIRAVSTYASYPTLLGLLLLIALAYLKHREDELRERLLRTNPHISSAIRLVESAETYLRGAALKRLFEDAEVLWGPVVCMAHDALLAVFQRMIIDSKGIEGLSIIEGLKKNRELHLSTLVGILRKTASLMRRRWRAWKC